MFSTLSVDFMKLLTYSINVTECYDRQVIWILAIKVFKLIHTPKLNSLVRKFRERIQINTFIA
jgi:hypothetical protein